FGVLLPMIPGIPYMFVIALIYGAIDHFHHLTLRQLGILGIITIVSLIIDYLAGMMGAKFGGAKGKSLLYGFIGLIVGTFIVPVIGGLIGLFLGVLIGELFRKRAGGDAVKAATGSVLGSLAGMI